MELEERRGPSAIEKTERKKERKTKEEVDGESTKPEEEEENKRATCRHAFIRSRLCTSAVRRSLSISLHAEAYTSTERSGQVDMKR